MSIVKKGVVRAAGYEVLYLLGGFLATSAIPTVRNQNDVLRWIDESRSRRELLRRMERQGLIEFQDRNGEWVPALTALGQSAFSGGRNPRNAWERPWDQQWRLLTFDLPRNKHAMRMKLGRWLGDQHFGRLQGSVWIRPDAVGGTEEFVAEHGIDPTSMVVFEGTPAGEWNPGRIAAKAWDFESINEKYRGYVQFSKRALQRLEGGSPSRSRFEAALHEDRTRWWEAVRSDPLLPKAAHPKGYEGPAAWKCRAKLLKKLHRWGGPVVT